MAWREFPYYKPSTPLAARGGIKAQSKQGGFGRNWWARRWIAVLEGLHLGARITRGRSYARRAVGWVKPARWRWRVPDSSLRSNTWTRLAT